MSKPIFSAPLTIADNPSDEMALTHRQIIDLIECNTLPPEYAPSGRRLPTCSKLVRLGLFF